MDDRDCEAVDGPKWPRTLGRHFDEEAVANDGVQGDGD